MKRHLLLAVLLALPGLALAGPDDFICDTAIYGGETALVKPNVLIIFDTSGSMSENISTQECVPNPDYDLDGILDVDDNCPFDANASQADADGDGIGDACDAFTDRDGDGIKDQDDNCPTMENPDQLDTDHDGVGDLCDNCPNNDNSNQRDDDGDGVGNVCDTGGGTTGAYNYNINYTDGVNTKYCEDGDSKCKRNQVYQCDASDWNNGNCDNWYEPTKNFDLDDVESNCGESRRDTLYETGQYIGRRRLEDSSSPKCQEASSTRYYATGNWIVWYNLTGGGTTFNPASPPEELYAGMSVGEPAATAAATGAVSGPFICTTRQESKNSIAKKVVEDLIRSTEGVRFGVMQFNNTGGNVSDSKGAKFVTRSVAGSNYVSTIKEMTTIHTGTTTNEDALVEIVQNMPTSGYTPLGESMYEAMRYFTGGTSAFSAWSGSYTSPITASCQQTYIIFMTDGMSTSDDSSVLTSICGNGDCDHDGNSAKSDSMDDIAYYLHNTDLSSTYAGTQNVLTFTIGFGLGGSNADAVQLLEDTAANGGGTAYLAENYQALSGALTSIIGQILEVNSAFVAPVVPTNPENKTYSGKRVYLGFFKPITNQDWQGNLKKYGLNYTGMVVDKNGVAATDANGRFLPTATSFWSINPDGANVDEGGVGNLLSTRNFSTDPRLIYTYTGTQADLTHSTNRVIDGNVALTAALLQGSDPVPIDPLGRTAIINYVTGFDAYDSDFDGNTTERRDWIMGDILHSKPAIQTYSKYTLDDESDITKNSSYIFIGSNDGQIHCFRDADGREMWSFITPMALSNLRYLGDNIHNYYMDGSPRIFAYDRDGDGNIGSGPESAVGDLDLSGADDGLSDKVIMVVGMRRGGGIDNLSRTASRGSYIAIDITDPLTPKYLWEIKSTTSGYGELGETWSAVQFGQVRVATPADPVVRDRLVAFIGGGYDTNEDLRFGNTQTFPGCSDQSTEASKLICDQTETTLRADDTGLAFSPGTLPQWSSRGRGIYVLELGIIDGSGAVTFHSTPVKLWEWTYASPLPVGRAAADNPTFSIPSEIVPLDKDFDGLVDYLYAGDTGGNMWRFTIKNRESTANWFGTKIFSANPSTCNPLSDVCGHKIMEPPSVIVEPGYVGLYFGSGDRAHPLNKGVTDRLYALYDRGQTTAKTEANLVDVTSDYLQAANPPTFSGTCTDADNSVECTLKRLSSPSYNGWFIKLDQNAGEKALSPPVVFNKVAYYTTFTPNVVTSDPCLSGNLGQGRTYALDYKTGGAVFSFSEEGDSAGVLDRDDRGKIIGPGIPSGVVVFIREDGTVGALAGCGGGLCPSPVPPGGIAYPIYWMQE